MTATRQGAGAGTTDEGPLTYRERLWAPWWVWLAALSLPFMLGVAWGYAVHAAVGLGVGATGSALVAWGLTAYAATVAVDEEGFHAGRALLEPEYVGAVSALDPQEAARQRGVGASALAFTVIRGYLPAAVRVDVDDPRDPTPYWYVSTRHPQQLAWALRERAGRPAPPRSADASTTDASG